MGWHNYIKGQGVSRGPQPAALRRDGNTAAHTKSYDDEAVTAGATGEKNRETQWKYLRRMKKLSSKKAKRPHAQLKCPYTNACCLGKKQEELASPLFSSVKSMVTRLHTDTFKC